mmetsp:Transcript_77695/g.136960  ORF Transcript_77695/g.136960 Transcript_77695/m.136960 type:complete len:209 (+) Transcript_77695:381-1007(+)
MLCARPCSMSWACPSQTRSCSLGGPLSHRPAQPPSPQPSPASVWPSAWSRPRSRRPNHSPRPGRRSRWNVCTPSPSTSGSGTASVWRSGTKQSPHPLESACRARRLSRSPAAWRSRTSSSAGSGVSGARPSCVLSGSQTLLAPRGSRRCGAGPGTPWATSLRRRRRQEAAGRTPACMQRRRPMMWRRCSACCRLVSPLKGGTPTTARR